MALFTHACVDYHQLRVFFNQLDEFLGADSGHAFNGIGHHDLVGVTGSGSQSDAQQAGKVWQLVNNTTQQ